MDGWDLRDIMQKKSSSNGSKEIENKVWQNVFTRDEYSNIYYLNILLRVSRVNEVLICSYI